MVSAQKIEHLARTLWRQEEGRLRPQAERSLAEALSVLQKRGLYPGPSSVAASTALSAAVREGEDTLDAVLSEALKALQSSADLAPGDLTGVLQPALEQCIETWTRQTLPRFLRRVVTSAGGQEQSALRAAGRLRSRLHRAVAVEAAKLSLRPDRRSALPDDVDQRRSEEAGPTNRGDETVSGGGTHAEADKIVDLISFLQASLRRAIFRAPESEGEVQNAIEGLLIGRGLSKGLDYDRETGRVKVSIKEVVPDFILPKLGLALEVKLCKDRSRSKEIVDQINADIRAYGKGYASLLFIVYDLGSIRDEAEFKQDLESANRVRVIIVKH